MNAGLPELVAEGRAALREGDAAAARRAFEGALGYGRSGDVLEGLARVSYLELDYAAGIEAWEQAYALHRDSGDWLGAVRVARMLAYVYGTVVGDRAVMSGWIARARTLVRDATESVEGGWVILDSGRFGDPHLAEELFREALAVARRVGDAELECVTLAYLGASLVHADRIEEGMVLLDEALAAVAGSEIDDFVAAQEIFCQLFAACEHAHDVSRAEQWMRIGSAIAERRNLPAVSAFCHTHYGGIMTVAGRWPEADAALTEAVRLWGLGHRSLRGSALVRLAELRVLQGRFEEAEQLLADIDVNRSADAARPVASIQLARGEVALARDVLERALARIDPRATAAAPLLSLLVEVHLAAGALEKAETASEQLTTCATAHDSDYVTAAAALARGRVCLAAGSGDPQACLREALAGFVKAQTPIEEAHVHLELAVALSDDQPEVAIAEARAALEGFERLNAARSADAVVAVLRSLGVRAWTTRKDGGLLTKREAEVLDLLGHGLSNPEISERLYISRKTVEHHVSHILAKLGLRSRAEVAAYVLRSKPVTK